MKLQEAPSCISKTVKFPASVTSYLRSEDGQREHFQRLKGGLLKDTQYAWLSCGPNFEVIRTSNGAKVAAWTFGAVLRDFNTQVTCVCELPSNDGSGRVSQFAVGLECKFVGGVVCVFDIRGSKVLRAVQVPSKVTSMSVVDSGTGGCYPLPQIVSSMTGILAVGLSGGDVLLLDLCRVNYDEGVGTLPSNELRDELHPCQILNVSVEETGQDSLEIKRMNAARTGDHLAVVLNERYLVDKAFLLTLPDGKMFSLPKHRVDVTALMYIPRIASVVVGFSFGNFQIWNLMNLSLEYVSPTMSNPLPVVSFGFQEPCDDPRNFCYLWAVHSNGSSHRQKLPFAVMYALLYQNKEWVDGYGYLYQEFVECNHRFEFDLDSEDSGTAIVGGCSITCNTINKVSPAKRDNPRADLDESIQENDLSLTLFVWETWGATCPGSSQMALFDLNQWYKEQMPMRIVKGQASTYMTLFSLDDVVEGSFHAANPLLDVRIDPASISQFTAVQSLEEHFYPSALSFESLSLLGEELVIVNHPGVQRDILSQLEQSGPFALLHPTKLFHHCNAVGLKPVYTEVASTISCPVAEQREFLLSFALEYQLVGFLSRCATEWMDGSQSAMGCTLQGLLKWGWQRATTLKAHADSLCIPLYDYSGMKLDSHSYQLLDYCGNQLHHLTTLFQGVLKVCKNPNIGGIGDLEEQAQVLELVALYIEVVEWFVNVGLLPESSCNELSLTDDSFSAADNSEFHRVPYPGATLTKSYKNRREELERLSRSAADKTDILFIDGLVKRECNGDRLSSLWERDGGTGLYPPPSIQSLLRTYLLDGIPLHVKHCIVIYVFMDLTSLLDSRKYDSTVDQFVKFPAAFRLTPSFIKITQALWLLDHQDFAEAIDVLLDPLVSMDDLKPWQHQCIVRAFLYQGQHQMALKYIRVQQPPLKDIEDIRLNLTVLLVNGLIHEAFQYQRQYCNEQNSKDLLQHFFSACQQMNQLSVVLQLALSPSEEEEFIQFLQSCQNPRADDMRVMYYLERSRVAEAMEVNDSIRSSKSHIETASLKRGRSDDRPSSVRDTIVQAYANTLPSVTRKLAQYCAQEKSRFFSWKQVSRPTPMSVAVHRGDLQPVRYRSSLIQATLEKARETWSQVEPSPAPPTILAKRDRSTEKSLVEMTPFLCTPRAGSEAVGFDRDITAVVFPILTNPSPRSDDESIDVSPMKRFCYSEHYPLSHRKKIDRYANVDAQSLLQTPHVRRKSLSLSLQQSDTSTTGIFTPQSILKVRKFVRQSSSPDNASQVSLPSFTPTSTTPDLAEENEEPMQVSDEEIPTGRQIRFSLPMENLSESLTPEIDDETDFMTRSTAKRSIVSVTPRKPLSRSGRLGSTPLSSTVSEENNDFVNVDVHSTRVVHEVPDDVHKGRQTRITFHMEEPSQELSVTPEFEERTGPVTRSVSKRSIVGGTPRKPLPSASRLSSATFKSSASGESNRIISSQVASSCRMSHDTILADTKPLEDETESASVENDSDPFYSLENSVTGMLENVESPLKKQKASSSDKDTVEEKSVTEEKYFSKTAMTYIEKDDHTVVKGKFVSRETTIKTTEISEHGTDALSNLEGDMSDALQVVSSSKEKPSQNAVLGKWSSFEMNYEENSQDNSNGVIEQSENEPEVATSSVGVSFAAIDTCEVEGQEQNMYEVSESTRMKTVDLPVEMEQSMGEEYVDRSGEANISGNTCQIVVEDNYHMEGMVHDPSDLLESVLTQGEDLEGNNPKEEDASSPEITIEEEKMNQGILIDTSTCSMYFETSIEETNESQVENQAENFPTLVIESVCGAAGISPCSEDDQKDFQTLQPMSMLPVEELNVNNEMEVSPDLPDVLLASDGESKDINQKLDLVDSEDVHEDDLREEEEDDVEDDEDLDDEDDSYEDEEFDFVRQQVAKSTSNDEESIILLDSEEENVQQTKTVESESKMRYLKDSEEENTDIDEEEREPDENEEIEQENISSVSEVKKGLQKVEYAPENGQSEHGVSMTKSDVSEAEEAQKDDIETDNSHSVVGMTEVKSKASIEIATTSGEGIVTEKDEDDNTENDDNGDETNVQIEAMNTSDEEVECSKNVDVSVSIELVDSSDEEDSQVKESASKVTIVEIFEKDDLKIKEQTKDKSEEGVETKSGESIVILERNINEIQSNNTYMTSLDKCGLAEKDDKVDGVSLELNEDIPTSGAQSFSSGNFLNEEMDFEACISFSEISKSRISTQMARETSTLSMDVENDDIMDFEVEIAANQISKPEFTEVPHKDLSVADSGVESNVVSDSDCSHFVMEVQQSINETYKDEKDMMFSKIDKRSSFAQVVSKKQLTNEKVKSRAGSVPPVNVTGNDEFNVQKNLFRGRSCPPEEILPPKRKISQSRDETESAVGGKGVTSDSDSKPSSSKATGKNEFPSKVIKICEKEEQAKRSRLDVIGEEPGKKELSDFNILHKQKAESHEGLQKTRTRAGSLPPEKISNAKIRRSRSGSVQPEDLMTERVAYGTKNFQPDNVVEKNTTKTNSKTGCNSAENEGRITQKYARNVGAVEDVFGNDKDRENQTPRIADPVPLKGLGADEIENNRVKPHKCDSRTSSFLTENIPTKEMRVENLGEGSTFVPSEDISLEDSDTKSSKHGSKSNSVSLGIHLMDNTEKKAQKPEERQDFIAHENLATDETKSKTHKPGRRADSATSRRKSSSVPPEDHPRKSDDSVAHENRPVGETKKNTRRSRTRTYSVPPEVDLSGDNVVGHSHVSLPSKIEPRKSSTRSSSPLPSRQSNKPECSSGTAKPSREDEGHTVDIPDRPISTANIVLHDVTSNIVESTGRERAPSVSSQASTIHLGHSRKTRSRRSSISSQCSSSQDEGMELETSNVRPSRSRRSCSVQRDIKLHVVYEEPEVINSAVNQMEIVVGEGTSSQATRGRRVSESLGEDSEVVHEQGNRTRSEAGSVNSLQVRRSRARNSVSESGSVSEVSVGRTLRSGKVYSESEDDTRSPKSGRFVARQRVRADSTSGGESTSSQQVMEEYATARRLTRYQKLLLERSMEFTKSPVSQPTSCGRLPALPENSDDEDMETSSVGTRSSRLSAQRNAAMGTTSPESSQASTVQATPQRTPRHSRRSLSRLKDNIPDTPGSVKSDASTVYASSVASCPADTSPTSVHSEDIQGSRTRCKTFQNTLKSASEKGYPMWSKGSSPGESDISSETGSIQSDNSHFTRSRSCLLRLSKLKEDDFDSPSSFQFSPPTVVSDVGRKEVTSLPVPAFVFSPPQKQQPHPKVHRSNVAPQQTRAHTMALRSLQTISEDSSPSTSSSASNMPKSSERVTTPIAVKRSKKFKHTPKSSSQTLSKLTPLTEEEKRELGKRVSRRFYWPETKRTYSAFKQRKIFKLRSSSKSRP